MCNSDKCWFTLQFGRCTLVSCHALCYIDPPSSRGDSCTQIMNSQWHWLISLKIFGGPSPSSEEFPESDLIITSLPVISLEANCKMNQRALCDCRLCAFPPPVTGDPVPVWMSTLLFITTPWNLNLLFVIFQAAVIWPKRACDVAWKHSKP